MALMKLKHMMENDPDMLAISETCRPTDQSGSLPVPQRLPTCIHAEFTNCISLQWIFFESIWQRRGGHYTYHRMINVIQLDELS